MRRAFLASLVILAIVAAGSVVAVSWYAKREYQLTLMQAAAKALERSPIQPVWLVELLTPPAMFRDHVLDGEIRSAHPRILVPELETWAGIGVAPVIEARLAAYPEDEPLAKTPPCSGEALLSQTVCWITTGSAEAGALALATLRQTRVAIADTDRGTGTGWQVALAYDLLSLHPEMEGALRATVEGHLMGALERYLKLLDDPGTTLWHRRATLAANAWLVAVVLSPVKNARSELVARAQAHFLNVINSLALTEAWPEGYNYWINNRALPVALAAAAYINGLTNASRADDIKRLLERVGLWHVYATRPDHRIEAIGDEGPRVDLKDETRRVIDVIAQVTESRVLAGFSRYLAKLHAAASYYRGYRWSFILFNDSRVAPWPGTEEGDLSALATILPKAQIFGRNHFGQAYIRSGWAEDSTFISFRAGKTFSHHGHYDAGHFTLFKGAPLVVNGGTYGAYFSEHRLHYALRTVSKNSLLILRPNERVYPNRFFEENVADGGQRVVIPTGNSTPSVAAWRANVGDGLHFEGGHIEAFDYRDGSHAYLRADLTEAYNTPQFDAGGSGGKVKGVVRELLYLFPSDVLVIKDTIVATKPEYKRKWLLHAMERPQTEELQKLIGSEEDGIFETRSDRIWVSKGRGKLRLDRLRPKDGIARLIGGPSFKYYVEVDGDDAVLDGRNMSEGARPNPWFDDPSWRIEIQPQSSDIWNTFLITLAPSIGQPSEVSSRSIDVPSKDVEAAEVGENIIIFSDKGSKSNLQLHPRASVRRVYVLGLDPHQEVNLGHSGRTWSSETSSAGFVLFELGDVPANHEISLSW